MTVLVRPEQIELHPADAQEGLTGRIIRTGYHGHDAVLRVQAGPAGAPLLLVRTLGDAGLTPETEVKLRARGPVLVWPAGARR